MKFDEIVSAGWALTESVWACSATPGFMRRAAAAVIPGLFGLANARRSIRSFTDQPINDTLLHNLLYTGLRSSSSGYLPVSGRYPI